MALQLEAWSLQLVAFFFQLSVLYSVLDGGKYGSYLIYSFINFLCLALPYFRSGSVLIFFKISFCLSVISVISSWLDAAPLTIQKIWCILQHTIAAAWRDPPGTTAAGRRF